jgi:hypothetical protein
MGDMMVSLLFVVDAWYEITVRNNPEQFQPADRVEILGRLVRLVSQCFGGFNTVPNSEAVSPVVQEDGVGLSIHLPGPIRADLRQITSDLAAYGFSLEYFAANAQLQVRCPDATILPSHTTGPASSSRSRHSRVAKR